MPNFLAKSMVASPSWRETAETVSSGEESMMHLTQAMTEAGLTAHELESLSGLSIARIEAIGDGAAPTLSELGRLADALALDDAALLTGASQSTAALPLARLRANDTAAPLAAMDQRTLSRLAQLAGELEQLRTQVPAAGATTLLTARQPCAVRTSLPAYDDGYRLARVARETLGLGPGGAISSMTALLGRLGVMVVDLSLTEAHIEAFSLVAHGTLPVVALNIAHPKSQQLGTRRAALAHELCHLLYDTGKDARLVRLTWDASNDELEQRANAFGAEFLAPLASVRRIGQGLGDVALTLRVAEHYGISLDSALWRLIQAKRIPKDATIRSQILKRIKTADLQRFAEDGVLSPVPATLLQRRGREIVEATAKVDLISSGRHRELLTWA